MHCLVAKRKLKLGYKPVSSTNSTEIRLPYCQKRGVTNRLVFDLDFDPVCLLPCVILSFSCRSLPCLIFKKETIGTELSS